MAKAAIHRVLATVPFEDEYIEELRRAFDAVEFIHVRPRDDAAIADALTRVDVAVHYAEIDDRFLRAPNLKWVHCDRAGLTQSARPEVFERGLIVTGSAGRSAPALAQHAFFFALALTFDSRGLARKQAAHEWGALPGYHDRLSLYGQTLGVVGLGHTGRAIAELGQAFGMKVVAFNRSARIDTPHIDRLWAAERGESVEPLLREADVVMIAAPLTDETHNMFDAARLGLMKPSALLINVARGGLVDHDALIEALRTGAIAGAGLDVTDPEPLPADSPLWDLPNVLLTPHVTPKMGDRTRRSVDIIVDNIRRYRAGEPLNNALDPRDVYSG